MKGVMLGNKHSYNDWNLYLGKETKISFPKVKESVVDIPGADSELDLSEVLTGDVKYKTRDIKLVFYKKNIKNWKKYLTEIASYLHGQKLKIIFDDDLNYYYIGRCSLNPLELDEKIGKITIDAKCDPYKYYITSTTEDWFWDSFNFDEDIIQEYSELEVENELEINLINSRKRVVPTFTVSSNMEIEFENNTYNLVSGVNKILDIELKEGNNNIKITGTGTISIEYRRGCL